MSTSDERRRNTTSETGVQTDSAPESAAQPRASSYAYDTAVEAVSDQFRAGLASEYGSVGRQWLGRLPQLLESLCARWELELTDLAPRHRYLSLVWQVTHRSEPLALKVTVPSTTFARETAGLLAWNGRAMARLERHDVELGAALLQWLDASTSLADVPIGEAVQAAGQMLAVTPIIDRSSVSTYENARVQAVTGAMHWPGNNSRLGDPLSPAAIRAGEAALARIDRRPEAELPRLVNHDLHYENVIRVRKTQSSGSGIYAPSRPWTNPSLSTGCSSGPSRTFSGRWARA